MTTNVSKGAGRAAAKERTSRHAQRTPLPARKGKIEDAKFVVDSLSKLQEDLKSASKAREFAEKAIAAGWSATVTPDDGMVQVIVKRENGVEAIHQAWVNGVWQYDASTYTFADRTTKPRNASGAAKLLTRAHEDAATEMNKVASNKHFRKREPRDLAPMRLPFDPAEATEEEIHKFLRGQTIVWYNRLSRGTETAMFGRNSQMWVTEYHGERTVTMCCPATGFRSFHLSAVLKVGRGRVAKTQEGNLKVELEDAA